jgi:hypothetical protein
LRETLLSIESFGFGAAEPAFRVQSFVVRALLVEGTGDGHGKAGQVVFDDVVRSPAFQALDGGLVAEGARDQDEGQVVSTGAELGERVHPRPVGEAIVAQDDIERLLAEERHEFGGGPGDGALDVKACPTQLQEHQLRVRQVVLDQ